MAIFLTGEAPTWVAVGPQRLAEPWLVMAGEGGVAGACVLLPDSLFKRAFTSFLATRNRSAAPANRPARQQDPPSAMLGRAH